MLSKIICWVASRGRRVCDSLQKRANIQKTPLCAHPWHYLFYGYLCCCIYVHLYIYMYVCIYIYVYQWSCRRRRAVYALIRDIIHSFVTDVVLYIYICKHIYIHIYIYIHICIPVIVQTKEGKSCADSWHYVFFSHLGCYINIHIYIYIYLYTYIYIHIYI